MSADVWADDPDRTTRREAAADWSQLDRLDGLDTRRAPVMVPADPWPTDGWTP